jgi:hypothetical protein
MPTAPHIGKHLTGSETVRDVVIGMADGLTYRLPSQQASRPLSLRPGSSPPLAWRRFVAGAIEMGLGGYGGTHRPGALCVPGTVGIRGSRESQGSRGRRGENNL